MSSLLWLEIAAILLGLLLGSFLNVCIARLPFHESIVKPGSRCPHCQAPIRAYDNIPVLSFLLLRGRCRHCKASISWQYPLVELAVAAWFVIPTRHIYFAAVGGPEVSYAFAQILIESIGLAILGWLLIGLIFMDWQTHTLPDAFTLLGIGIGFFLICAESIFEPNGANDIHMHQQLRMSSPGSFTAKGDVFLTGTEHLVFGRLAAILAATFLLWFVRWAYKRVRGCEGLGAGDVKLLAMIAAFLGFWPAMLALFLGVIGAALYAVVLLARGKAQRSTPLPFGAYLSMGGIVAAVFGEAIVSWYARLL
ncbi:prepilin peptidase [Granulicella cerasi]|uniref:Prepilin peptidase n=1 Tax=Granulicella cerasi TaxID=741063 RepID=A0ABW1Z4Q8_9BACT|nr:A24 family peptidase [Granulicella cerasi]